MVAYSWAHRIFNFYTFAKPRGPRSCRHQVCTWTFGNHQSKLPPQCSLNQKRQRAASSNTLLERSSNTYLTGWSWGGTLWEACLLQQIHWSCFQVRLTHWLEAPGATSASPVRLPRGAGHGLSADLIPRPGLSLATSRHQQVPWEHSPGLACPQGPVALGQDWPAVRSPPSWEVGG